MKKLYTSILVLLLAVPFSQAQRSQNIAPASRTNSGLQHDIPTATMPAVDVAALLAQDALNEGQPIPFRFGSENAVDLEFSNSGLWETLANGDRVWRMRISSPNAISLNFQFDGFYMPEGAIFHIYDQEGENIMGAFTSANNQINGDFATGLIAGDHAIMEYFEPASVFSQGTLGLRTIVHGYRDIMNILHSKSAGGSGACNINVACPEGVGWEDETAGVTRLLLGGGLCTGSMINDVPESGTPYYLTANHCISGAGSAGQFVFLFNYEASTCNGSNGPANQTLTGSVIRANSSGSDFALLELNNNPPANYETFYAGWTRSTSPPPNTTCIHHPSGDIKKISKDFQAPQSTTWDGASVWDVNWNSGVTEGGSSGSPLFDDEHHIIGQLFGGSSSCSNPNGGDVYGKFNVSWNGSSSSNRLRDWLDPNSTDTLSVDGWDLNGSLFAVDANLSALDGVEDGGIVCGTSLDAQLTLINSGNDDLTSATINWTIDGSPQTAVNWTGDLEYQESEGVDFGNIPFSQGAHTMQFIISSPNGGADENILNDTVSVSFTVMAGNAVDLELRTDALPTQTTWELADDQGTVLYSGGPYSASNSTHHIELCLPDGC